MADKKLVDLPKYGHEYFGIGEYEKKQHIKSFSLIRWSDAVEMQELASELLEEYVKDSQKGIRFFNRDKEKYLNTLIVILSNCVDSIFTNRTHTHISRNSSNFKKNRYAPVGITYRLFINLIDWLSDANYINLYKAEANPHSEKESEIIPLEKLKDAVEAYEVKRSHLINHGKAEYIEIRKEDKEGAKKLVDYKRNTKRSNHDREVLRSYTRLLNDSNTKITIDGKLLNSSIFMRSIYVDNFSQHGRIYGGAWQNCKAEKRKSILINGKQTVEVDIVNCTLRMALQLAEVEAEEDDLYSIKEYPRGLVKDAINYMFNIDATSPAQGSESVVKALLESYPNEERKYLKELVRDCKKHYEVIADEFFFKGKGLELHYIDSEICVGVIKEFTDRGKGVLTVHDSFITCKDDEKLLASTISLIYEKLVKQKPILRVVYGDEG